MAVARRSAWQSLLASLVLLGATLMPIPLFAAQQSLAIDGGRSSAHFIVHLRLRMRAEGRIARVSGELRGDAAQGWSVRVDADGRSLRVAGPRWMDRATRSDAFLAVERFPDIRFQSDVFSDEVLHAGGAVEGKLTLRGLTRAVSFRLLPSACADPGRDCDLQVQGKLSRTEFGMTAHRASVKDQVELHMRVRLRPAGPAQ